MHYVIYKDVCDRHLAHSFQTRPHIQLSLRGLVDILVTCQVK